MKLYLRHFLKYAIGAAVIFCFLSKGAYAAVTLSPEISAGNIYTDNVYLTTDNEKHDFITTIGAGIEIDMRGRFSNLSLSYNPVYASYLRFPEEDTLRHRSVIDGSRQITRTTRVEFTNNYQYTEEPLYLTEGPLFDIDTTVRKGRDPYHRDIARLGVINQFGPENVISLEYDYYFLKNKNRSIEDREYYRPSSTLIYWPVPDHIGTESEIRYTRRTFDSSEDYDDAYGRLRVIRRFGPHFDLYSEYTHESTDYIAESADYQVSSPLLGFIWDESVNSSFSAGFGYFYQDRENHEDESGPVGAIETRYTFRKGTAVSISGNTGYDRATSSAENLGFNKFYSIIGTVAHPLGRRVISNLIAGYRRNIYTELDTERKDTIWEAVAGLTYQALPWMTVEFNYSFRKLDSDFDPNDYTENRAAIFVTLNPMQPVMLFH